MGQGDRAPAMYYGEVQPAPRLASRVAACWHVRADGPPIACETVIPPDGCVSLVVNAAQPEPIVVGPFTEPMRPALRGGDQLWGVRLLPGVAPMILSAPLASLRNRRVPLADIGDLETARRVRERLAHVDDEDGAVAAWDESIAPALLAALPDPVVSAIARRMMRGGDEPSIECLAREAGLSPRQLRRRFTDAVGLPPKVFLRLRRLRASLHTAMSGSSASWTDIAGAHGFADQAHFAREAASLTGHAPGRLRTRIEGIRHGKIVDR